MQVVAGLGNIGEKYAGTRHNVGFEVVDLLAARGRADLRRDRTLNAAAARIAVRGRDVLLVQPHSLMNLSGDVVRRALDRAGGTAAELLVVSDDYHLPLAALRLRGGGSAGGHNGLADVERALGTQAYARLRVGIGSPGRQDPADFVLSRFRAGERRPVDEAVERAAEAVEAWIVDGLEQAMARYNGAAGGAPGRTDA